MSFGLALLIWVLIGLLVPAIILITKYNRGEDIILFDLAIGFAFMLLGPVSLILFGASALAAYECTVIIKGKRK